MPIHLVELASGKRGYQWGYHGHIYQFTEGDQGEESWAYEMASRQARAAYAHGYRG